MAKERIIFDPTKWPTHTYNHIRYDQSPPTPEAFWTVALGALSVKRKSVEPFESWWIDLSSFHPTLKRWKLTGHGTLPATTLNPKEYPHKGDTKLAKFKARFLNQM